MEHLFAIILGIAALGIFVWLLWPGASADEIIDPSDSRQIGVLIGMTGGDIADAAVARFALQRFEEIHGRRATTRDLGLVAGLMTSTD